MFFSALFFLSVSLCSDCGVH